MTLQPENFPNTVAKGSEMIKRRKLTKSVLVNNRKLTYNQARLNDLYRSMDMSVTHQPKVMQSTSFDRLGESKWITSSAKRYQSKRNVPDASSANLRVSSAS